MQAGTRLDLLKTFIEFIGTDIQRERQDVNKRMFSVLLWCFVMPALLSITLILLIRFGVIPRAARLSLDWIILLFPVSYSLYVLSSEVLVQIPMTVRRGGIVSTLGQSVKEGVWRERVCEAMKRTIHAGPEDWKWLVLSFKMDLKKMRYRTGYLTALAGAVFYLLLQGIDLVGEEESQVTWIKHPLGGWIESSSNDFSQFVGLGLFLVLFYLSGMQTFHSLMRYLNCAELVMNEQFSSRPENET